MLDVVLLAVTIWLELCSSHSSSCYHYRHHPCSNKIQNGDIFVLDNIGPPEKWLLNRREREEKEREKIHKYITFFDAVSKPKQISGKSIYHEQGPVPVDDLCLRYGSSVVVDDPVQLDTIRSRLQLTWYVHVALSHGRRRVHAAQNQHVYHNESTGLSVIRLLFHAKAHRQNLRTHTSSSDHVDSRGPLRQPRVATTSLGPFGTNAEWCTVADLLDPWMARASWPSPPTRTKTGASSSAATCDNARGGLACGHRVSPHGRTMNFVSWRWYPERREGWSGRHLLCFWQSHSSVSRGSYLGNARGRPRASVYLPAEVSMFPNRTTKWIVYKSCTSEVFSAVEAGLSPDFVHRVHGSRSDANAHDNVWLTPARSRLNRPQICKFSYFFQRVAALTRVHSKFEKNHHHPVYSKVSRVLVMRWRSCSNNIVINLSRVD